MKLTQSERMELQQQAASRTARADSARHARLIPLLADGLTWAQIRTKLTAVTATSTGGANASRVTGWPGCSLVTPVANATR